MSRKSWVLFDYGGVICYPQPEHDVAALAAAAGVSVAQFCAAYWARRLEYDLADLDADTFWKGIAGQPGGASDGSLTAELVRLDVASWSHLQPGTVRLIQDLATATSGHRLALLSNAPHEVAAGVAALPVASHFEHLLFSCDLRLAKPDPRCFRAALSRLAAEPAEVIFIDDREDNVGAAASMGIRAIRFTDPETVRSQLRSAVAQADPGERGAEGGLPVRGGAGGP
jgi:putative hydrolase of the HAD superfamily